MKQIERYIFGRIASLTLLSLSAITILALTTQILIRVDVLTTSNSALLTFFKLSLTLVPEVVLAVAPFALLVGIGRILTTMNEDSELVVIEASGASNIFIAKPIILFSVLLGIGLLLVANFAGPKANRNLYSILSGSNTDIISLAISSGKFRKIENGLYIQVAESLPGGGMGGIFLSDRRDPSAELIYYAKVGTLKKTDNANLLVMNDGEIHRSAAGGEQVSVVNFKSYVLDMASFIPSTEKGDPLPKELYLPELLEPDTTNSNYESHRLFYNYEIHFRLSSWLYTIAFGAIMAAFLANAQSNRAQHFQRIASAVITCVIVRVIAGIILENSKTSVFAGALNYIFPIFVTLLFMLQIYAGYSLKLPKSAQNLIDRLQERITSIFERRTKPTSQTKNNGAV
ncbi:LptF/LptG family permease [Lentilitoribacter sp. Alg239-R112]|uniref:LptF/LptG family permease n=1 Tax=Lentilitoribacter sp. Alg239-R112 TaxID=2305987 RepID=UPI0013A6B4BA|nr:LptF/LptG family permease [Lentilitoribacter sp. Alg239-R112]